MTIESHENESTKTGRDVLADWLCLFDRYLASKGVKPHDRPLKACDLLVQKNVIDVPGGVSEYYFEDKWFKAIYKFTEEWFEEKYGKKDNDGGQGCLLGVVYIYNTPYLIKVPHTIVKKSIEHDGCYDMHFPRSVCEDEDVLEMVCSPPNFKKMTEKDILNTKRKIISTAKKLRNINLDIMMATIDVKHQGMRDGIIDHLRVCAEQFADGGSKKAWFTYWELQLAIEKVLKTYLSQSCRKFSHTHNLKKLYAEAGGRDALGFGPKLLDFLPNKDEVVDMRYYGTGRTNFDFLVCYKAGLSIVARVARRLKSKISFGEGAVLTLKKPEWV